MPSLESTKRTATRHRARPGAARDLSSPLRPIRRRIDNIALRWHARLDSPFADRSLPWILAGSLFLALAALALAQVRSLAPSESLARYTQAAWQLHADRSTELTLVPSGVRSPQPLSHLDGALVFYPLGWLVGFLPIRETLVVVQAAALAFTVLPLWRLARRVAKLRVGATAAVVVGYALYPPLHLMNTAGFDPRVLAIPVLMSLIYRALSGSRVQFALAAVAVLACSTQFAVLLIGFGVMLAMGVRRRAGLVLVATGGVAAIGEQTISWLGAGDHGLVDGVSFAPGVRSGLGVLGNALAHPVASISHLGEQRVLVILAALLVPAALLPLLSFRHLAPVIPLQLVYLLGALPPAQLLGPLAAGATAFVFASTTFALANLGRLGTERVSVPPRLSAALVGVAALFFMLDAPSSLYHQPWQWGGRDRLDGVRLSWTEQLIDGAGPAQTVAATSDMAPILADEVAVCMLPRDRYDCPFEPDVFLVDRELDQDTPRDSALLIVESSADGRFVMLRRSS